MDLRASAADPALPLRLTLLVLVLRPPGDGSLKAATWLVAGAGLVFPGLLLSPRVWLVLCGLVAARIAFDWPLADNHIYLLAYWCLAVGLSFINERGRATWDTLGQASRWLLAAAFFCAVVWKALLAPDYLDGRFFRVTLSTDDRFAPIVRAAGLTDAQIEANRKALEPLPAGIEVMNGPVFTETPALNRIALALTWGGLLLELAVAVGFLGGPGPAAHGALLAFCALTYAVAPVAGFGWLVAVMGLASCPEGHPGMRAAYVAAFALILLYAETAAIGRALDALTR